MSTFNLGPLILTDTCCLHIYDAQTHSLLPVDGLDAQIVSLVGSLHEANAGDALEGLQPTLNDGALAGG